MTIRRSIAINTALAEFGEANGIDITFTGDADWEANINTQVEGGNPPNIGIFPQPGKLADFASAGVDRPAERRGRRRRRRELGRRTTPTTPSSTARCTACRSRPTSSRSSGTSPRAFEAAGFEVPETFDEFTALIDQMKADGDGRKPLCVGIESGTATGWTFTDWIEEMVLRQHGGDVYDQWVTHEIPFNDPQIVEAMQQVLDLWTEENVFASGGNIAATNFGDNAQALFDDQCYMHRQANVLQRLLPGRARRSPTGPRTPSTSSTSRTSTVTSPVLTAGTYAAAFDDDPATMAVLAYMATPEYAQLRQATQTAELDGGLSGFLSAVKGQDPSVYQPLEQGFLEILNSAELSRFDGSDLMPADVGCRLVLDRGHVGRQR